MDIILQFFIWLNRNKELCNFWKFKFNTNNKVAYLWKKMIYIYAKIQYYVLYCILHVVDSMTKHPIVSFTDRKLMDGFRGREIKSPLLIKNCCISLNSNKHRLSRLYLMGSHMQIIFIPFDGSTLILNKLFIVSLLQIAIPRVYFWSTAS